MKIDPDKPSDRVSRRCIVLISGFDPRGASFYNAMFAREAEKHAQKNGIDLDYGRRRRLGHQLHEWTAKTNHPGYAESVRFVYLGWDDLVRKHWTRSRPAMFCKSCVTYFVFLKTGGLYRCFRLTWYPMFVLLFPVLGFIALYLILMLVLGAAFVWLVALLELTNVSSIVAGTLGALAGAGLAHLLTPRLNGAWLLRSYSFSRLLAQRPMPELDERLDCQVADLLAILDKEQPEELVVCAHSSGVLISIPLLDRLLHSEKWQGRVSLLTLGQCIPLTSFLQPRDGWFNASMKRVALHPQLDWIDFSMPSDGACFALVDPVSATFDEKINYPNPDLPKFLSPQFMQAYPKERYEEFKRKPFVFHFLYLMSPDLPVAFDLPLITLGDMRLAERFLSRKNQAKV